MELEGVVKQILPQTSGSSPRGAWTKQDFVIEQHENFNKKVCVSVWGDKIADLAKLSVGDKISIGINVESREYNNRWYTEIRAWKITSLMQPQGDFHGDLPPMDSIDMNSSSMPEEDMPF